MSHSAFDNLIYRTSLSHQGIQPRDAFGDIMKYLYYDLGEQQEGSWVVAQLRGSAANVILVDPLSFEFVRRTGALAFSNHGL